MNKNPKKIPEGIRHALFTRAKAVELFTRAKVAITPSSFREADNSVEFVLATEAPADVFDPHKWEVVQEVLVASGVILPANGQVPLVNSHDRSTIDNIFGSVREIRDVNTDVIGRLFFAADEASQRAMNKVKDLHIDSGSVGYEPVESIDIPEGETYVFNKKAYQGPLMLTTKWKLKEFSLVAVGADENAKARKSVDGNTGTQSAAEVQRKAGTNTQEANAMKMTFNQFCRAIGTDIATLTESQRASLELVFETYCKDLNEDAEIPAAAKERSAKIMQSNTAEITRAAIAAEKTRAASITALCQKHNLSNLTAGLIEAEETIERAQAIVLDEIAKRQKPVAVAANNIEMGETDGEKFRAAAVDGLMIRNGSKIEKAAPGYEEFRGKSMIRLAELCLQRAGIDTRNMTSSQIATEALRQRGEYTIAAGAADFTSIVLDASNKSLQRGYNNPDFIWNRIASIGSASDFKTINRIQLFEAQDLVNINEHGDYTEAVFKDGKETYALQSKGLRFTLTRKAIINDDTSAFSRIPMLLGNSAARSIEKAVLDLITGGIDTTTTADGDYLFATAHNNISAGSALAAAALGVDMAKMMAQTGRGQDGSTVPAFVMPKFSLVPVALKMTNDIICMSASDATASYSSGVINPIERAGIVPLSSPYLDLDDVKRRYLLADPNRFDSIEVSFLDGQTSPMLEEVDQTDADGRVFKVRLDVGAGILDWRGLLTNAGQ